jgi:hypothetical protein
VKVTLRADMGPMDAGLATVIAGYKSLDPVRRMEFKQRYTSMTMAGAEWVEIRKTEDALIAEIGEDLRRLCSEFGIKV